MTREMKTVTVVLDPYKLDELRESLSKLGVHNLTVTDVTVTGDVPLEKRGKRWRKESSWPYLPKVKVEMEVKQDQVNSVCKTISASKPERLVLTWCATWV